MRSLTSTTTGSATTVALPVHPERPARIVRALHRVLDVALGIAALVAVVVFVGIGLLPRTGWYRVETVLSGSMRPDFAPGDMVVVTPESTNDLRIGQVITYAIPVGDHHVETHRIAKILQRGARPVIRTKGDANNGLDPWVARLDGGTAWRVSAVVPHAGRLIIWFRSPVTHFLTVFLAPLLLAFVWLRRIWRDPESSEQEGSGDARDGAPSIHPV
jgi:signal peptidase